MDLCEFEVSLVYRTSSRTGSKATEKLWFEKKKQGKKERKKSGQNEVQSRDTQVMSPAGISENQAWTKESEWIQRENRLLPRKQVQLETTHSIITLHNNM